MADPASVITAASEALSLVAKLATLIEQSRASDRNRASLGQIIQQLRNEALGASADLGHQLRHMIQECDESGIDLDRSIGELQQDLHWYNFVTRSRLNSLRTRFYELHRRQITFLDDVTALLVCSGTAQSASSAFAEGMSTKEHFDRLMMDHPPLRRVIEEMISFADEVHALVEGGARKRAGASEAEAGA